MPIVPAQSAMNRGGYNMAYAAPTDGGDGPGYVDSPVGAWAQQLRAQPGDTPDPMREQTFPVRDFRPDPRYPPAYFWTGTHGPGTETIQRHGVEFQDADGIETRVGTRPRAADPRWVPTAEPRWTQRQSPHNYVFTRPYAQETERYFSGAHFSMADHRRTYPILGMAATPYRRNTYRADPTPWDVNRVDMPNPVQSASPGRIVAYDIPPASTGNSWRL